MGCASVPDTPAIHDETEQSLTLGIAQVRGNPDHFLICADCPSPTQKTTFRKTAHRAIAPPSEKTHHAPRKLVIHFDHASSVLKNSDRGALARLVNAPPESHRLTITGYTDNTAAGGTIANETLAQRRAPSLLNYLSGIGVDKKYNAQRLSALLLYRLQHHRIRPCEKPSCGDRYHFSFQ